MKVFFVLLQFLARTIVEGIQLIIENGEISREEKLKLTFFGEY